MIMFFFVGVMAGIILSLVGIFFFFRLKMFQKDEINCSLEEAEVHLEKLTTEKGWKVLQYQDLQQKMKSNGYDVEPVKVFDLCKPLLAVKILSQDQNRFASAMMPCRISIYQQQDGKFFISRINSGLMSAFLGKRISGVMKQASLELENVLQQIIKKKS